jgi:hypothetical protein
MREKKTEKIRKIAYTDALNIPAGKKTSCCAKTPE